MTRRPSTAPVRRSGDESERTTAVYLSLSLHAVAAVALLIGYLTRSDLPTITLHQEIDIVSVSEFDPLWSGRLLTREPLDSADRAARVKPADAASEPVPTLAAAPPGEPLRQTPETAPSARSPLRPEVVSQEADDQAVRPPASGTPESASEAPASNGAAIAAVGASGIERPTARQERSQPRSIRAPVAVRSIPTPDSVRRAPIAVSPSRAPESAARPVPGLIAGAPAGVSETAGRPARALAAGGPATAPEDTARPAPSLIAGAPAGVPESKGPPARAAASGGPARAPENTARPIAGVIAGAPAGVPETVGRPANAPASGRPARAPENTARPIPGVIAGAPAELSPSRNRPVRAPVSNSPAEAPEIANRQPPAPVSDDPADAPEGETPPRIRSVDVAVAAPRPAAAPLRAGEVKSPDRRHPPAAALDSLAPASSRLETAVEAPHGGAQAEAGSPALAAEGRLPASVEADGSPRRFLRAAAAGAAASAIELSFRETGTEAAGGRAAPEPVEGVDTASIPARINAADVLDGLLPFQRPKPTPAPTPAPTSAADLSKIAGLLAGVACGRLSGDLDETTGSLRLDGHVPSLTERAKIVGALARIEGITEIRDGGTVILPQPLCQVLDTLRTAGLSASKAHQVRPQMLARPTQAGIKRFAHGERIVVRLTTPRWPAYVHVDFYDLRGQVTHLVPNPQVKRNRFEPGSVLSIGEQGSGTELRAGAPYGVNILVAIGTSHPLFDRARPPVESADGYLADLASVIARLRRADTEVAEEYVYVFLITQDIRRRSEAAGNRRGNRLASGAR